jgi:hypothetical protein
MNFLLEYLRWFKETDQGTACGWFITCGVCVIILCFFYTKVTKGPYE